MGKIQHNRLDVGWLLSPITFTSFTLSFAFWLSSKEFSSVHIAFSLTADDAAVTTDASTFSLLFNGIFHSWSLCLFWSGEDMAPLERWKYCFFDFFIIFMLFIPLSLLTTVKSLFDIDSPRLMFRYFSGDAATLSRLMTLQWVARCRWKCLKFPAVRRRKRKKFENLDTGLETCACNWGRSRFSHVLAEIFTSVSE